MALASNPMFVPSTGGGGSLMGRGFASPNMALHNGSSDVDIASGLGKLFAGLAGSAMYNPDTDPRAQQAKYYGAEANAVNNKQSSLALLPSVLDQVDFSDPTTLKAGLKTVIARAAQADVNPEGIAQIFRTMAFNTPGTSEDTVARAAGGAGAAPLGKDSSYLPARQDQLRSEDFGQQTSIEGAKNATELASRKYASDQSLAGVMYGADQREQTARNAPVTTAPSATTNFAPNDPRNPNAATGSTFTAPARPENVSQVAAAIIDHGVRTGNQDEIAQGVQINQRGAAATRQENTDQLIARLIGEGKGPGDPQYDAAVRSKRNLAPPAPITAAPGSQVLFAPDDPRAPGGQTTYAVPDRPAKPESVSQVAAAMIQHGVETGNQAEVEQGLHIARRDDAAKTPVAIGEPQALQIRRLAAEPIQGALVTANGKTDVDPAFLQMIGPEKQAAADAAAARDYQQNRDEVHAAAVWRQTAGIQPGQTFDRRGGNNPLALGMTKPVGTISPLSQAMQPPAGAPAQAARAQGAPAPLPPGVTPQAAIAQGKAAIAAGKDPQGVAAKLRGWGIDPALLAQ